MDDGSVDGTTGRLKLLAQKDPNVKVIIFRKNYGQTAALSAGFDYASGEIIVAMDADLHNDPEDIPAFIRALESGLDVVVGWRKVRKDRWTKRLQSRLFNLGLGLTGLKLHDHNCGLKGYRVEVVREIRIYGELHRFITLLAHARGFRVTEMEVQHRPRIHGQSHYGMERFAKGLLDLFTVRVLTLFGDRPLHFLGAAGLVAFAIGFLGLAYLAWLWVTGHRPIGTRPVLIYSAASLLLGAQMMSAGILAELIVAKMGTERADPNRSYSIAERVGFR